MRFMTPWTSESVGPRPPFFAAGGELDVDAAFGWAAGEEGVGFGEQIGVIRDELAQADVHAFFIAFCDEDDVHWKLAVDCLVSHQSVKLSHLRPLGVGRAAADQDAWNVRQPCLRPGDDLCLKGRCDPGVGLRDGHGVVLPVDGDRLGSTLVALGVDDGVAGRAILGDPDVVDARRLTAHLVEEALYHLGGLGDTFTGVRDTWLLDPLLQILDVLVDVRVDVVEHLLDFRWRTSDLGRHTAAAIWVDAKGPVWRLRCALAHCSCSRAAAEALR